MIARFTWVLVTLLSYHLRHPLQTVFLLVGLVTGVALWGAVQQINAHARASYAEADQFLGAEARYWIRDAAGNAVPADVYIDLRRRGFISIYPVVETRVPAQRGGVVAIVATDLLALPLADGGSAPAGANNPFSGDAWTSLVQPDYEAWFPAPLAERLDIATGDRLALRNGTRLPPARIQSQPQQGDRVFMDVGAAIDLLGLDGFTYIAVSNLSSTERTRLERALPSELQLIENRQAIDLSQLTQSLHTNLSALGLLSFAVGIFIVFNAVRFSLTTRQRVFSTLQELGVGVKMLVLAVLAESVLWSAIGAIVGSIAGYTLGNLMLPAVASTMQNIYGAPIAGALTLQPSEIVIAFAVTLLGVLLAVALPLWQRMLETVREGRDPALQWQRERRYALGGGGIGILLILLGAMLYPGIESVSGGFVMLAAVMFGGAMMLPAAIRLASDGVGRLLTDEHWRVRWAVSDAVAQLPHLRVALMALMLTLVANIGVTTLVGSFRTALGSWLDTRLSADLYVQSDSLRFDQIADADWLVASHQRAGIATRFADRPAEIIGIDPNAPDVRSLSLLAAASGARERWQASEGDSVPVLANEQVRYLAGIDTGATVELETSAGRQRFEVVGFVHDYGNAEYAFYLPKDRFETTFPEAREFGVALWVGSGRVGDAERDLEQAGARPGDWIAQGDIRQLSFAIFDRTFEITGALNGLTLLVCGVALLSALLAIHQSRLPEYSFWRSMGMNWREWFSVVSTPLLLMVLVTGLFALPLGLALSWLLIHRLNVIAFGWTMPLTFEWTPVAILAGLTFLIVMFSLSCAVLRVRQTLPNSLRTLGASGT